MLNKMKKQYNKCLNCFQIFKRITLIYFIVDNKINFAIFSKRKKKLLRIRKIHYELFIRSFSLVYVTST